MSDLPGSKILTISLLQLAHYLDPGPAKSTQVASNAFPVTNCRLSPGFISILEGPT